MPIKNVVTVNGKELKRVSKSRAYAYAIVATYEQSDEKGKKSNSGWASNGFEAVSWSSRLDLAQKALAALYQSAKKPHGENRQIVKVGDSVTFENKFQNVLAEKIDGVTYAYPSNRKIAGVVLSRERRDKEQTGESPRYLYNRREWFFDAAEAMKHVAELSAEKEEVYTRPDENLPNPNFEFRPGRMYETGRSLYSEVRFIPTVEEAC